MFFRILFVWTCNIAINVESRGRTTQPTNTIIKEPQAREQKEDKTSEHNKKKKS